MRDASGSDRRPPAESADALRAALERERARAREIDHRTKNTLQLVSSLVLLLSRRVREEETRQVLRSLHQRIGAIAAVHRGRADADQPEGFDLADFIRDQTRVLSRTAPETVTLQLDLEPARVAENQAVPLALIVNELTANALVHAAGERPARVTVTLRQSAGGLRLSVEDDGPGLAPDAEQNGFGLTMVRLMVQQLGATLALEGAQPGLRAVVTLA